MSGREPPRLDDSDDWFAEFDDDRAPMSDGTPVPAWSEGLMAGRTIKLRTLIAAGAVVTAVILVAGLALAGVFSSGGNSPAAPPPTTTHTTTTTPTTPTTPTRPVLPAPATTLKPGDQGLQVKRLQRALARLGYKPGAVDGDYGTATQTALKAFQQASKLTADGVLGPKTLAALKQALR